MKNTAAVFMVSLLIVSTFLLALEIQPVKAEGTIYIRADGSIDPPEAGIDTLNNITYFFTSDVSDQIVVERNNIIIDGNGWNFQGTIGKIAITASYVKNVTFQKLDIRNCSIGAYLVSSSNCTFSGNNIADSDYGVRLDGTSNSTILGTTFVRCAFGVQTFFTCANNAFIGNHVVNSSFFGLDVQSGLKWTIMGNLFLNNDCGIFSEGSSDVVVSDNNFTGNRNGVRFFSSLGSVVSRNIVRNSSEVACWLDSCPNSDVYENELDGNDVGAVLSSFTYSNFTGNVITDNQIGVACLLGSTYNRFFHNNLINNTQQAFVDMFLENDWDDGYPSGGNYWSDHLHDDTYSGLYQNETGSDGICDTPYVIGQNNIDDYPLASPWSKLGALVTQIELQERSSTNTTLYETMWASNTTIQNAVISGDFTGSLNFTSSMCFAIETGPFAGKAGLRGNWTANAEGARFDGTLEAFAYFNPTNRSYTLRGVVSGDFGGTEEGTLTESVPNSGLFDVFQGVWILNQISNGFASAAIELQGTLIYHSYSLFPSTGLSVTQLGMNGNATGFYSGSIGAVVTQLMVKEQNIACSGQGFATIAYDSLLGSGEGWALCRETAQNTIEYTGLWSDPISGIMGASISQTEGSSRLTGTITRTIDVSYAMSLKPILKVEIFGPDNISPGQTFTYAIHYANLGLSAAKGVVVCVFLYPPIEVISSSEGAGWDKYYNVIYWYAENLPARETGFHTLQARTPWGLPTGTSLGASAYIIQEEESITKPSMARTTESQHTENLLIGGINFEFDVGQAHRKYEAFARAQNANWIPTYFEPGVNLLDKLCKDKQNVYLACKDIPNDQNGLTQPLITNHDYGIVYAYSGGTRTAITAILHHELRCRKLVLISPILDVSGDMKMSSFESELEQLLGMGVEEIEIYQSPQDVLPLLYSSWQAKFDLANADTQKWLDDHKDKIDVVPVPLHPWSYGPDAHWELFLEMNRRLHGGEGSSASLQSQIVVAHDPNAKYGPPRYVSTGQTLYYTIEYENEGEGIAFGVYVTDTLDMNLNASTLNTGGNGTYDASLRTVTWYIGEVGPHENGTVTFTVGVNSDVSPGSEIVNVATVHFPSVPETTLTNSVVNVVAYPHDVALLKVTPSAAFVEKGSAVVLNVTVENQGLNPQWFNVTALANGTMIETKNATLNSGEYATLTFEWNTALFHEGYYNVTVYAWPVPTEGDVEDNVAPKVWVVVGTHDFAVASAILQKSVIGEGYSVALDVSCENRGDFVETSVLVVYANGTVVESAFLELYPGNMNITTVWNTAGCTKGVYNVTAYIWPVSGEENSFNNALSCGWVIVTGPGDVDADFDVDIFDIVRMAGGYSTKPPNPKYIPNCDIDGDGDIDIFDIVIAAGNYGESW